MNRNKSELFLVKILNISPGVYRVLYQVCLGRISSCEEGKGISWLWQGYDRETRERGSNIIFPMISRLLVRIPREEEGMRIGILGKKIKILKYGVGDEYQVLGNFITSSIGYVLYMLCKICIHCNRNSFCSNVQEYDWRYAFLWEKASSCYIFVDLPPRAPFSLFKHLQI